MLEDAKQQRRHREERHRAWLHLLFNIARWFRWNGNVPQAIADYEPYEAMEARFAQHPHLMPILTKMLMEPEKYKVQGGGRR